MYDEMKPKAVGAAIVALIEAIREDGPGIEDLGEMSALIIALGAAAHELTDTDAAIAHILSGASDAYGDKWVNKPV